MPLGDSMLADLKNTNTIMEKCDKIKTEYDGRSQLFLNINSSFETSEEEHSYPNKRAKLCEQNMFWIDRTRKAPENMNSESGKNPSTNAQNSSTFTNNTYLCDVKTASLGPSNIESNFRNPQVSIYARRPPKISFDKQFSDFSKENSSTFTNNTYLCDVKTASLRPSNSDTESNFFHNPQLSIYARPPPKISFDKQFFDFSKENSSTFTNNTYLCDVKTVSPGPSNSDTESNFQNPQVSIYARTPPKISFDKQFFDFSKENSSTFTNNTYLCDAKTVFPGTSNSDTESNFRNPQLSIYARPPPKISFDKQFFDFSKENTSTFTNNTYLCDVKTASLGPSNIESNFRNPQVSIYARPPPKISFDKQVFDFSKEKCHFGGRKQLMKKLTSKHVKSVVLAPKVYRHFTLYPPQNGIIPKVEQLPGCKTVVISGFPHILKYCNVKSTFKLCGKTQQIRTVERGVFQITYACQTGVDNVTRLNGYKVGGVYKDVPLTGTIKVEFAPIWVKKHGFDCEKLSYPRYSKKNAAQLIRDLEQDRMIERCVNVLIFWLEWGKSTKSNYLNLFLVLKAVHASVARYTSAANKFEEFVRKNHCNQILKAFTLACSETVLDNLNQFKNQVVKWKQFIEEINCCKSWEAVSALKKTKLELKNCAQQESTTSNSLSKRLYPKNWKRPFRNLIESLEQDHVPKTSLNKVVFWMKEGKCTMFTCNRYFIVLETMYGFISRFTSDPTKFDELVRQGYCGMILKAFSVACSETVKKNFKKSAYRSKIKKWKEYIEEIDKCKSWEAFVNRKKEQKMVQSEILLTEKDQPNVDLKAAETMTYNQISDIQDHKTANLNNENNIDHNDAGYFKSENSIDHNDAGYFKSENNIDHNDAGYFKSENNIDHNDAGYFKSENNIDHNDAGYFNSENNTMNNETRNHSNGNDIENIKYAGYQSEENEIPNNETVRHSNETGKQSNENDIQNKDACNHNNENGIQNNESNNQNKKNDFNQSDIGVNLVEKEAHRIAALGAFLHLHSFGASIEDICKYLLKIDPTITCQGIEDSMRKFPALFMEELTGDDSLKTKWTILGL
ncbi:hypothetical protein JTE90_012319 [Oedothorax gibbosus]|uniref:RRM domain-containing protein n=1 Tax=Oedothorax gibbosus TaxID=931172 RepID=A0AAV6VL93_9ARAC|nr:hypothetical protein JTE90_012319 [Oedothorax gibbosus]